jgi:Fe-coproporphyrin III synthase
MVVPSLRYLNVLVTSRCNLRCKFCNIGTKSEENPTEDSNLTVENFQNLFVGHRFPTVIQVHLSGGEPFLRADLIDVCDLFATHCPNASISIATNGTLTERIAAFCKLVSARDYRDRLGIGISLDGIGELHDSIRGVKGTYVRAIETISRLRQSSPGVLKSIGLTLIPENVGHLSALSILAKESGLTLYFRIASESPIYYGDNRGSLARWGESQLGELDEHIKQLFPFDSSCARASEVNQIFFRNMVSAYRLQKRHYDCFAGLCSVFIDHNGDIRPCNMLDASIGNIAQDELSQVLRSKRAGEVRRFIEQRKCFCWLECETLNSWSTAEWLGIPIHDQLSTYSTEVA